MADAAQRLLFAEAALALAAERGWRGTTVFDIAARAALPVADLAPLTPADAFDCVDELMDRAAAVGIIPPDLSMSPRERVFDAAMRRFEAMQARRAGVLALEAALDRDPAARAAAFARAGRTARWLLALAGEADEGVLGASRAQVLAFALGQAKAAWRRDDAGDYARTMAALDKALRRNESLFDQIGKFAGAFRSPRPQAPPAPAGEGPPEDRPER
ncbi:MAG: hypothetical protein AB7M12_03835 [Hyphomonadaceae bacterium]